jgi:hypothetical protein
MLGPVLGNNEPIQGYRHARQPIRYLFRRSERRMGSPKALDGLQRQDQSQDSASSAAWIGVGRNVVMGHFSLCSLKHAYRKIVDQYLFQRMQCGAFRANI